MKIIVEYFDEEILLLENKVFCIEILNKKVFSMFVSDLIKIKYGDNVEEIRFIEDNADLNLTGKIEIINDFFNLQYDSKKILTNINKYLSDEINYEDKEKLLKLYNKLLASYEHILSSIDLPLEIVNDCEIENILKMFKVKVKTTDNLLENLLLLIELESLLKIDKVLFFTNLKLYLTDSELLEFIKYAIYNNVYVVLIDSIMYDKSIYENKLNIDENFFEVMSTN